MKACERCEGTGTIMVADKGCRCLQCEHPESCPDCKGTGKVQAA